MTVGASPAAEAGSGLRLRGITKRFGSLVANDAIDLDILPGEIHCLLGENGAGKSTLMNVLYGLLQPDEGTITVDGARQVSRNPGEAIAAGIGMVHQHFMLVEVFTVAENLVLGREGGVAGFLDMRRARRTVRQVSERYRLDVDPDALVEDLPVGVQQRVEILKALANDAKYLIFDEPTAVLTPQEIDELIEVMRSLRGEGKAIVFITHKLREVRAIADRITVIRRGKVVGTARPTDSEADLAELMVGRAVSLLVDKEPAGAGGKPRLQIEGVSVAAPNGTLVVDDLSLEVAGGEIVCIAGVQGNGQTELAEALLGVTPTVRGRVVLDGTQITGRSPREVIDAGLGFVPEDRKHDGFVGSFSVAENLVLNHFDEPPYARGIALDLGRIRANADDRVAEFDIRTQSVEAPTSALSGGNQQKVVLARELSRPLSALIANQPTRGVDVGAIEFLHSRLVAERDRGTAVLIVSTELDEVTALADRVAVMYRGRIVGIVPPDTSREVLGLMMAGVPREEALAAASVTTQAEEDAALAASLEGSPSHTAGVPERQRRDSLGGRGGSRPHTAGVPERQRRDSLGGRGGSPPHTAERRAFPWVDVITTAAAFVLAFFVGALLMIFSDTAVRSTFTYFFARPGDALAASWEKVSTAYAALFTGAVGGYGPITETTAQAAPLICAGLGVGLAFRAGLFNIGAQGQAIVGAILAAYVGFALSLPPVVHLLVAVLGGMIGGGLWGGIVGWLKARAGAHEVIVTIMLNYIGAGLLAYLLTTTAFQRPGRADPISPIVDWNATFPRLQGGQLHLGFVLALLAAVAVWWLLDRSTTGFAIRAVGANPHAAGTAGMSVARTTVITMVVAGALAGLAGAQAALGPTASGVPVPLSAGIVGSIGFDAITVALLGRSRPLGTVLAGLLFGGLHAGGLAMQSIAQTPLTLTTVLQALIVLFVAAPALIHRILPFVKARRAKVIGPVPEGGLA